MKNGPQTLRPQDVLVLLKLISWRARPWRQIDVASEVGLSQAEVANALERLKKAGLVDESKRKIQKLATSELLIHAIKYIYPAEFGPPSRGMPTAHSSSPLSHILVGNDSEPLVWPSSEGKVRGISLYPIYSSVPAAAEKDSELHALLSLVDSLRVGQAREKKLAEEELKKRIMKSDV
jgi:DNA-binding Lrp family transcriptional regulator